MFMQSPDQRHELLAKAIEEAGGYVPRNPEVLHRLHAAVFRPLPSTATHAELAYAEGQRALVTTIIRQYQLAMTGSLDTPWPTTPTAPPQPQQTAPPKRLRQRKRTTS